MRAIFWMSHMAALPRGVQQRQLRARTTIRPSLNDKAKQSLPCSKRAGRRNCCCGADGECSLEPSFTKFRTQKTSVP
ncbi:hypothetical protein BJY01DRAFT_203170 [Aspergillus pseudoustus]|uniref:Secreted protein n=1 Tax=Aspergillus pseudoustus TaxID=1810923 RepID=A0ABR4KWG6_9EURO